MPSSSTSAVLAVDLGKTGCRAALWTADGARVGTRRDGPGAPGLAAPHGVRAAEAAVRGVLADLPTAPLRICLGAAGAAAAPDAARELAELLLAGLGAAGVVVCSDAVTSHAGALAGRIGVVLAAGTGAVAVGVSRAGRLVVVDGAGPELGDDGSGAWIGRAGLRAAVRAVDGRGPSTGLVAAASAHFDVPAAGLPGAVAGDPSPPRAVAAFAPEVARLAAAGDRAAAAVLGAAAAELAATVLAAARRLREPAPVPVALTGGLLQVGAVLLDPLAVALAAAGEVQLVPALGSALDGGRLLAADRHTVYEPLVVRVGARCTAEVTA